MTLHYFHINESYGGDTPAYIHIRARAYDSILSPFLMQQLNLDNGKHGGYIRGICNYITPWSRVILEKLTVLQLGKKSSHFMEPEGSLPCSQKSSVCLSTGMD